MRSRLVRVMTALCLCVFLACGTAESAITIAKALSQTGVAGDGSVVSKAYAAHDPANDVYLAVWSNYASKAWGQFVSGTGTNIGAAFRISPINAGFVRVVWGADGFLVTYNRTGTSERWGRFITLSGSAPQMSAEQFLYTSYAADSDSGMTYLPGAKQYLLTFWRNTSSTVGYTRSFLVGVKNKLVNIPETQVSANESRRSQDSPDIACDEENNRCLIVGKAWDNSGWIGTWARFIDASNGVPSGNLFYLDSGTGLKEDQRVAFSLASGRFVVMWVKSRAKVVARRIYSDLSVEGAPYTVIGGSYGQLGLSHNARTNTFVATFKNATTPAMMYGQELNGAGDLSGTPLKLDNIGSTGDGFPMTVPNMGASQYFAIHTVNFKYIYAGLLHATAGSVGGGGGSTGGGGTSGPTVSSLTPSPALPKPAGTSITWTAVASGGTGLQYQFWLYNGATNAWSIAQAYSSTASWSWTPSTAGQYAAQVWVRSTGSSADYDAWLGSGYFNITASTTAGKVTAVTLSKDKTLPALAGTTITWKGAATGVSTAEYQFWVYNSNTGVWSILQDYNTTPTFAWIPAQPGTYAVQVWARKSGSSASYEAWASSGFFSVTGAAAADMTSVTLGMSRSFPLPVNTSVAFTGSANGTAPHYRFWLYNGNTQVWTLMQDYSSDPSWTWTPTQKGTYAVQVWARPDGSTANYKAWASSGFFTVQ